MRTAYLVWGLVLALTASCGEKEAAPVTAAKAFARAMRDGDAKAVIALLEHDSHAHLERAAARAGDQVGGRRNIELHEMLQVVDVPHAFQVAKAELVTSDDTHAQVELTGADGGRHSIELVLQDGEWRVRVPVPDTTEDAT
ncbi:MAG: DUF4878 domain-containing protein [Deltaproteobacteria bacterium]|nr:DUF4878 domain-containing protein [Nannocystaceae bacterium]